MAFQLHDSEQVTIVVEVVAGDAVTVNIIPGEVMPKDQPA